MNLIAHDSINGEHRKVPLNCTIKIKHNEPIQIRVTLSPSAFSLNNAQISNNGYLDAYSNLDITYSSDVIPEIAKNRPLDKEKVINQINKTTDSIFEFANIDVDLDSNIFLPKISTLNDLRRKVLDLAYDFAVSNIKRVHPNCVCDNLKDSQILC